MLDISETRWCAHGKRFDDECNQCEIEEQTMDSLDYVLQLKSRKGDHLAYQAAIEFQRITQSQRDEIEQKQSRIDRLEGEKYYVVRILSDFKDGLGSDLIARMLMRLSPETTKDTNNG